MYPDSEVCVEIVSSYYDQPLLHIANTLRYGLNVRDMTHFQLDQLEYNHPPPTYASYVVMTPMWGLHQWGYVWGYRLNVRDMTPELTFS